jgi:hypothetical protein
LIEDAKPLLLSGKGELFPGLRAFVFELADKNALT